MRDLKFNFVLAEVGSRFKSESKTEPSYRLWSIDDKHPAMVRVAIGGASIDVEVWEVPHDGFAKVLLKVRFINGNNNVI